MSAPFGRPAASGPLASVRGASAFALALVGVSMVPAIAAGATFALVYRIDHRCPAPAVLRGSIEPERDLASLAARGPRPEPVDGAAATPRGDAAPF